MRIEFDNSTPIYQQIADAFKTMIISGKLVPGEKIKPVRDLAAEMGVNPNTMQKALTLLEQAGLVYAERTSGRFVTDDGELVKRLKNEMLGEEIERFFNSLKALGFDKDEILREINEYSEKGGL